MSDKLQFVAGFHHSPTAESPDKLKFVGHFRSLPAVSPKAQLLSVLLRNGVRFLPRPLPAPLSTCLAACLPIGSDTGLPCSACPPEWGRSSLSADDRLSTTGNA